MRMAKTDPLGVRLDPSERSALAKAAAADDRSQSALVRKIVAEWLRRHGWLSEPKRKAARAAKEKSDG